LAVTGNTAVLRMYAGPTNAAGPGESATVRADGEMSVTAGAVVYPQSDTTNGGSVRFLLGDLTVGVDGVIDADGLGYAGGGYGGGYGPGAGGPNGNGWGNGGGYGGTGGRSVSTDGGGPTYGYADAPEQPGSGGGGGQSGIAGGNGGGLVWIRARRTVALEGTITADGGHGVWHQNAGGSGGGVFLRCRTLKGAGLISAKGGKASNTSYPGGGGGGRIAVLTVNSSWAGTLTTNQVSGGTGYDPGDPGTVVWITLPTEGTVLTVR
jgi:hypothetical protein